MMPYSRNEGAPELAARPAGQPASFVPSRRYRLTNSVGPCLLAAAGLRLRATRCRDAAGQGGGNGHGPEVPAVCCRVHCRQCEPLTAGRAACCRLRFGLRAVVAGAAAGTAPARRRRGSAGAALRRPLPAVCGWNPYLLLS
jgi:hypothetical protein